MDEAEALKQQLEAYINSPEELLISPQARAFAFGASGSFDVIFRMLNDGIEPETAIVEARNLMQAFIRGLVDNEPK